MGFKIGEIVSTNSGKIKILESILMNKRTGYKYECLKDGYIGEILNTNLLKGKGCSVCSNMTILKGVNDITTTHPDSIKYFKNIEDAYKYSCGNGNKIWIKCPDCGFEKEIVIKDFIKRGFKCPKCNDGVKYPEKFMINFLDYIKLNFKYQLSKSTLKWCGKYFYDFYFEYYNEQYIVETHGMQHYKNVGGNWETDFLEQQKIDNTKKELALLNGIKPENYIIIDCRYSDFDFIKKNIVDSKLNELFDLSKIDWNTIGNNICDSLILKVCKLYNEGYNTTKEIENITGISSRRVCKYLKQGASLNMCDYDPKEKIKENGQKLGKIKAKKVKCLDDNKIYNSAKEASQYYGCNKTKISEVCLGHRKTTGGHRFTYAID